MIRCFVKTNYYRLMNIMENSDRQPEEESAGFGRRLKNFRKKKEEVSTEPPKDPTELNFQDILEKELGIIKVYDYAINNSLDLIYQPKLMEKYEQELIRPLIGDENAPESADGGRLFIRDEFERLSIKKKVNHIIGHAEEVAKNNGIKMSSQKLIGRVSIIIMVLSMASYFLIGGIGSQETSSTTYLIPVFLLMCIGPQLAKTLIDRKYNSFKLKHEGTIVEHQHENVQDVRIFIQDVIDDVRDRLISQKVALEKIQFVLFSEGYSNVRFVRNQGGQRGSPLRSIYQFDYPEGMGPANVSSYGKSGIPEDDANDLFIYLKSAQYDEEGQLISFREEIPPKSDHKIPEALLNASEFTEIDHPELVVPDFENYDQIFCDCGSSVALDDMKTSHSALHNDFEFYLMIGKKCPQCGKNPFILANSPGNEEIPAGLKRIFE